MKKEKLFFFSIIFFNLFFLFNFAKSQPPAITDLFCSPHFQLAGAVELSWTVPSGAILYEVKYIQGNSILYNQAMTYSQNWSAGNAGQKKTEIVFNLNPDTEFTFAIKSKDNLNQWSEASNPATCKSSKITFFDKEPPFSYFHNLYDGQWLLSGIDFLIEGKTEDRGGSSVKKVEISFDQGKSWVLARAQKEISGGFIFQYLWEKPKEGEYLIMVRATDWWENREEQKPPFKIKVVSFSAVEEKINKREEEKIQREPAIEELKAKIEEIEREIKRLTKILIELLTAKIGKLK